MKRKMRITVTAEGNSSLDLEVALQCVVEKVRQGFWVGVVAGGKHKAEWFTRIVLPEIKLPRSSDVE